MGNLMYLLIDLFSTYFDLQLCVRHSIRYWVSKGIQAQTALPSRSLKSSEGDIISLIIIAHIGFFCIILLPKNYNLADYKIIYKVYNY